MTAPAIRVHQLTHRYADGREALSRVSFEVAEGERVALVGANGAGKTTLFLRLAGVLTGSPGEIAVRGLDPTVESQRKQLPAVVGVILQNPDDQLFSTTVLEDVAFGPLNMGKTRDEARTMAEVNLHQVGLSGYGSRSPHRLSGGEKRRAALAGVLAMQPSVLLLDEPSVYLDPRGRRQLLTTLEALPVTQLVATHDLAFVWELCPRTIVLDAGTIVADGPTQVIMSDSELMARHGLETIR